MLLMMIERQMPIDRIICVDTTKEFPAMYRHIAKVQSLCPVQIETVKIDFDYWFARHVKIRGKRKGTAGYGWPDFRNRWCTALKQESYARVAASEPYTPRKRNSPAIAADITEYHGIAADEAHRTSNNAGRNIRYPLVEWGVTEAQALQYCYDRGLDWEGLYRQFHRVSCWCCPLSRIAELKTLHDQFPELWKQLQQMDQLSFRQFRADYSVEQLTAKFTHHNDPPT